MLDFLLGWISACAFLALAFKLGPLGRKRKDPR